METILNSWWVWAIRGVFAIIFGVLAFLFPGDALQALIWIFGAYALVDGFLTVYNALTDRASNWGWHVAEGVISVLAGIVAFMSPVLAGLTILLIIGFWAIFTGIMQMVAAWQMRKEIENEVWLGLAGLMSVIFGAFIFFDPLSGAVATAYIIGSYSIVFGVMFLMLAYRLYTMRGGDSNKMIPTA